MKIKIIKTKNIFLVIGLLLLNILVASNTFAQRQKTIIVVPLITSLEVYPNPAYDILYVKITFGINTQITLVITDISGKTVLSKIVNYAKENTILTLDISHFNTGAYFLKLICANGCGNLERKFIKQ